MQREQPVNRRLARRGEDGEGRLLPATVRMGLLDVLRSARRTGDWSRQRGSDVRSALRPGTDHDAVRAIVGRSQLAR
jgi:hypothetical protein